MSAHSICGNSPVSRSGVSVLLGLVAVRKVSPPAGFGARLLVSGKTVQWRKGWGGQAVNLHTLELVLPVHAPDLECTLSASAAVFALCVELHPSMFNTAHLKPCYMYEGSWLKSTSYFLAFAPAESGTPSIIKGTVDIRKVRRKTGD